MIAHNVRSMTHVIADLEEELIRKYVFDMGMRGIKDKTLWKKLLGEMGLENEHQYAGIIDKIKTGSGKPRKLRMMKNRHSEEFLAKLLIPKNSFPEVFNGC